ncbi:unnamed protein product [Leptidea sinapis]|uniref:Ig-like domain-containing protein n=1 Tax=Leptidea sinapis TaxID=189913 RepID=A0A5E4R7Z4_9NEOP|nr:unnamed protein product [Leptidea sinapis]
MFANRRKTVKSREEHTLTHEITLLVSKVSHFKLKGTTDCADMARQELKKGNFGSQSVCDLPRFVGPGSNVTVAVGRDAVFICRVDELQSFKNHRISVIHGDGTWTLVLRDVTPADGGSYMCQVNTEPMMSQLHELHVVVSPDIDDEASSGDVTVEEGERLALRCVASGTPTPIWSGHAAAWALTGSSVILQCTSEAYPISASYWVFDGELLLVAVIN